MENKKEMEQELQDVINKNLPAQVGETLRVRLMQANELEKANVSLGTQLENTKNALQKAEKENNILSQKVKDYQKQEQTLYERDDELNQRERELALREVRVLNEICQKEAAEKTVGHLKDVISTVFRNPTMQKSVFESNHVGGTWQWDSKTNTNVFVPNHMNSNNSTTTDSVL